MRRDLLLQLGLVLLAGVLQLRCATRWPVTHDDWWHLYLSEVQPPGQFVRELRTDTHPPVLYAVLRLIAGPETPPLFGRAVAALPGLLAVPLLFAALRALRVARPLAHAGAFLFATSETFLRVTVPVRSYALAAFFALAALAAFARLARAPTPAARWAFALGAGLAPWCQYTIGLLPAALLAALIPMRRVRLQPAFLALGAALAGLVAYYLWTRPLPPAEFIPVHLREPGEGVLAFLCRGANRNLSLFTPFPCADDATLPPLLLLAGLVVPLFAVRDAGRRALFAVQAALWTALGVLGAARAHPFGGDARQQFVLFLALVPAGVLLLDEARRRMGRPAATAGLAALLVAGGGWNVARAFRAEACTEFFAPPLEPSEAAALRARLGPKAALALFNLGQTGFYGATRQEGAWVRDGTVRAPGGVERERWRAGGVRPFTIFWEKLRWQAPGRPAAGWMAGLAALVPEGGTLWVTALTAEGPLPRLEDWRAAAAAAGLEVGEALALRRGLALTLTTRPRRRRARRGRRGGGAARRPPRDASPPRSPSPCTRSGCSSGRAPAVRSRPGSEPRRRSRPAATRPAPGSRGSGADRHEAAAPRRSPAPRSAGGVRRFQRLHGS